MKKLASGAVSAYGCYVLVAMLAFCVSAEITASAKPFSSPDIVVLGDSQISFGAGASYVRFFKDISSICGLDTAQAQKLNKLGQRKTAAIGVRSTSLHSWVSRSGKAKGTICDVDKRWGVNAGVYWSATKLKRRYVQIGKGLEYQFCKRKISAFEAMFERNYYSPKLLVMAFLGNSAKRWAGSRKAALRDVTLTLQQLPKDLPCIFMTTAPSYLKKVNATRLRAQENAKWAFDRVGARCSFVEGLTQQTLSNSTGNKLFFKTNKSGEVQDPHHPNARGSAAFIEAKSSELCQAVFQQLSEY